MVRVARLGGGAILIAAGVVMLVAPGPGLLTIAAGLGLWSRDVPFARRWRARVEARLPRDADGNVTQSTIWWTAGITVVTVGGSLWWFLLR